MITYTTLGYSDFYPGEKPTVKELLEDINSKIIIILMAMINAELSDERDIQEVQKRLTQFISDQIPQSEVPIILRKLRDFEVKTNGQVILWGKRYVLEMIKNEFINYRETDRLTNTPEEGLRIFKAYLLIADELNEKDRKELVLVTKNMTKDDPYFFEKLVWPFVLNQFSYNERVNPVSQMYRLIAFIKHSIGQPELLKSWKIFVSQNGCENLRKYLGSVNFLINVAQARYPEKKEMKVFTWIRSDNIEDPRHLYNLAFDRQSFVNNPEKQIDFLGMREKPLFQTNEKEFVALDLDYLTNKVYNGPLFDMYSTTDMATNTQFKNFTDFKSYIAREVSEKIIFKSVLNRLFSKKGTILHFDDDDLANTPDCYIRSGKKIFLIEFKDYLFPGKLVDQYAFEEIKKHIDLKFIKNEKGKNKGISQIIEQLRIINGNKFQFDQFSERNIKVFPIIIHTNFIYQMPGINHYLDVEFRRRINEAKDINLDVYPLVLLSLDTLFEFVQVENMNLRLLEELMKRYKSLLRSRASRFRTEISRENFIRTRASFDELFATIMENDLQYMEISRRVYAFQECIGITDEMFDSF